MLLAYGSLFYYLLACITFLVKEIIVHVNQFVPVDRNLYVEVECIYGITTMSAILDFFDESGMLSIILVFCWYASYVFDLLIPQSTFTSILSVSFNKMTKVS